MLKKFCPRTNCKEVIAINQKYCDKHQAEYEQRRAESLRRSNRKYDKTVRQTRDKQYYSFYHSDEWERTKQFINHRYKGLCLYSYFVDKKIVQADTVHHITEIKEDWDLRLSIGNLIPLSHTAHNRVHKLYNTEKDKAQSLLKELLSKWEREMTANIMSGGNL